MYGIDGDWGDEEEVEPKKQLWQNTTESYLYESNFPASKSSDLLANLNHATDIGVSLIKTTLPIKFTVGDWQPHQSKLVLTADIMGSLFVLSNVTAHECIYTKQLLAVHIQINVHDVKTYSVTALLSSTITDGQKTIESAIWEMINKAKQDFPNLSAPYFLNAEGHGPTYKVYNHTKWPLQYLE